MSAPTATVVSISPQQPHDVVVEVPAAAPGSRRSRGEWAAGTAQARAHALHAAAEAVACAVLRRAAPVRDAHGLDELRRRLFAAMDFPAVSCCGPVMR